MIYGSRVRKLREEQSLTKQDLASLVCVSAATINNWENNRSNPTNINLDILAIVLNTTKDYLTGMTDVPSSESATSETISPPADPVQTIPIDTQHNVCEKCGKPVPEGYRCCQECRWKNRWSETLLNSPELESRRKRSHSTQLFSLDREKPEAIFGASSARNGTKYFTTLETCTCHDFSLNHRKIPCKHILRLAGELGLFQSEYFSDDEDDYMMHVAPPVYDPTEIATDYDNYEANTEQADDSEEYQNEQTEMAENSPDFSPILPDVTENFSAIEVQRKEKRTVSTKFLKLLKYACCCVSGFVAIMFLAGALTHGMQSREWLCFPVAFAIAGFLTSNTAKRNGLGGIAFNWWLYGALVPVVSWVDVVIACSQDKVRGFFRGVAYSLVGILAFLIIFVQFLPTA